MSTSSPICRASERADWKPANPPPTMTTFGRGELWLVMSRTVSVPAGSRNRTDAEANGSSQPLACDAVHPTGEQIDLVAGTTRAVVTGVGAGLRALAIDGQPRTESFEADTTPPMGAGGVLVPW